MAINDNILEVGKLPQELEDSVSSWDINASPHPQRKWQQKQGKVVKCELHVLLGFLFPPDLHNFHVLYKK